MRKLLIFTALFSITGIYAETMQIPDNCTAFQTSKSMLFSDMVKVTGINCSQEIQIEEKKNYIVLIVKIPGKKFKTGNSRRNAAVGEILGDMVFTAELSNSLIRKFSKMQTLKGNLVIKGKSSPVAFTISSEGRFIAGTASSSLKDLGIAPPVVGPLGAIAKTHDQVTLGFKVDRKFILTGE
ncbi:MAG: hypothetical protein OEZ34_06425 [Spirochaetia bacterium]|nr:hypothetical protein [Spirochaetia bacterium]